MVTLGWSDVDHVAALGVAPLDAPKISWGGNANQSTDWLDAQLATFGGAAPTRFDAESAYGGIEFCPGAAQRLVLTADETAVPALASILEALPSSARGQAVAEVPEAGDILDLRAPAGMTIEWFVRGNQPRGRATIDAVRAHWGLAPTVVAAALADVTANRVEAEVWETAVHSSSGEHVLPDRAAAPQVGPDETYAWVAGDSDTVKAIRRILVGEVGLARHHVAFMGYWKVGAST
ncbi:siderophore-interacting protein [Intrasporangium calvum]|uniref:Siderophore-interacting protein n=1 Tax=Intrasporangium calvum TaxID=53358 RepID=A0ABT5GEB6_9MICO|nr:siderophore-interacting protein [Intrasporangium calvum]MDC5696591.1 siderophore-interacting protein [Intrasporangium calvum]